jgi:glycerophosphoryl diester phosphodiesterase
MSRALVVLSVLALAACSGDDALLESETPLVIAHGGGQGLGPDHTLPTYQASLDAGADVLELDIHRSADGDLVVMHDETVDRKTNGTGLLREMTTAEIQALDAGYRWSADGGETFPFRGMGYRVPTVREVIEAFPRSHFNIEIKQVDPPIVEDLAALLRELGLGDRTLVASFDDATIQAFRAVAPEIETSLAFNEGIALFPLLFGQPLSEFYEPPARFLQTSWFVGVGGTEYEILTAPLIEAVGEHGIVVHAWTINDEAEMDTLLARGVRGLITDFPGRARAAVDRR